MADSLHRLTIARNNLQYGKAVAERRADMAAQCECLAAWVDGRECICGERAIELPLSIEKLRRAKDLVDAIQDCDERLEIISKAPNDQLTCAVSQGYDRHDRGRYLKPGVHWINHDDDDAISYSIGIAVPKALLISALVDERTRLAIQLHETGIVSIDRDNIRVTPI